MTLPDGTFRTLVTGWLPEDPTAVLLVAMHAKGSGEYLGLTTRQAGLLAAELATGELIEYRAAEPDLPPGAFQVTMTVLAAGDPAPVWLLHDRMAERWGSRYDLGGGRHGEFGDDRPEQRQRLLATGAEVTVLDWRRYHGERDQRFLALDPDALTAAFGARPWGLPGEDPRLRPVYPRTNPLRDAAGEPAPSAGGPGGYQRGWLPDWVRPVGQLGPVGQWGRPNPDGPPTVLLQGEQLPTAPDQYVVYSLHARRPDGSAGDYLRVEARTAYAIGGQFTADGDLQYRIQTTDGGPEDIPVVLTVLAIGGGELARITELFTIRWGGPGNRSPSELRDDTDSFAPRT